jgi:hypothetical protein
MPLIEKTLSFLGTYRSNPSGKKYQPEKMITKKSFNVATTKDFSPTKQPNL